MFTSFSFSQLLMYVWLRLSGMCRLECSTFPTFRHNFQLPSSGLITFCSGKFRLVLASIIILGSGEVSGSFTDLTLGGVSGVKR
jgi:hypothetical protein